MFHCIIYCVVIFQFLVLSSYILDGVDYMVPFAFTPLRFDNSTTRACISIVIVDDTEPEGVEFFFANFGTPTSRVQVTQNTTRINIIDNDPREYIMSTACSCVALMTVCMHKHMRYTRKVIVHMHSHNICIRRI